MADPQDVARIRDYLKEHGATFSREALHARLVTDGHPSDAIDLAFAQEYGLEASSTSSLNIPITGNTVTPTTAKSGCGRIALVTFGILLLNLVIVPLLIAFVSQYINLGSIDDFVIGSLILVVLVAIIEGVAAYLTRRSDVGLSRGLTIGLGLMIFPILIIAAMIGLSF